MTYRIKSPIVDGKRQCTGACGEVKPLDQFYEKKGTYNKIGFPSGHFTECKKCFGARRRSSTDSVISVGYNTVGKIKEIVVSIVSND